MKRLEPNHVPSFALYETYAPTVFAYLLRQLRSREDAEDILLEVFTVVIEKAASLRGEGKHFERAWIMSIARNKVVDHYRRYGKHHHVPLMTIEDSLIAEEERQPEETILQQEEYGSITVTYPQAACIATGGITATFWRGLTLWRDCSGDGEKRGLGTHHAV